LVLDLPSCWDIMFVDYLSPKLSGGAVILRESLPFRRIEHVLPIGNAPTIIESHCVFCTFVAVSKDRKIVDMAEATHNCIGVHAFRKLQRRQLRHWIAS
jgi:hypothetical protein